MQPLSVSLIQSNIYWENPQANMGNLEEMLVEIEQSDIIVLPEMFSTGFTFKKEVADIFLGNTMNWLKMIAQKTQSAITGSFLVKEDAKLYNRGFFVTPQDLISYYDKKYLFTPGGEKETISPGKNQVYIDFKGWKLALFVCYDLRFPEWLRNKWTDGESAYDAGIIVANWPEARIHAWDTLLSARAIENQSYFIGVNRIGDAANGLHYPGHSQAFDFLGKPMISGNKEEKIYRVELDYDKLNKFRKKMPFYLDADL